MVGRKLDARVADAMIAFHLLSHQSYAKECSYLCTSMQLFVFVLRARKFSSKSQLFCSICNLKGIYLTIICRLCRRSR